MLYDDIFFGFYWHVRDASKTVLIIKTVVITGARPKFVSLLVSTKLFSDLNDAGCESLHILH